MPGRNRADGQPGGNRDGEGVHRQPDRHSPVSQANAKGYLLPQIGPARNIPRSEVDLGEPRPTETAPTQDA